MPYPPLWRYPPNCTPPNKSHLPSALQPYTPPRHHPPKARWSSSDSVEECDFGVTDGSGDEQRQPVFD